MAGGSLLVSEGWARRPAAGPKCPPSQSHKEVLYREMMPADNKNAVRSIGISHELLNSRIFLVSPPLVLADLDDEDGAQGVNQTHWCHGDEVYRCFREMDSTVCAKEDAAQEAEEQPFELANPQVLMMVFESLNSLSSTVILLLRQALIQIFLLLQ